MWISLLDRTWSESTKVPLLVPMKKSLYMLYLSLLPLAFFQSHPHHKLYTRLNLSQIQRYRIIVWIFKDTYNTTIPLRWAHNSCRTPCSVWYRVVKFAPSLSCPLFTTNWLWVHYSHLKLIWVIVEKSSGVGAYPQRIRESVSKVVAVNKISGTLYELLESLLVNAWWCNLLKDTHELCALCFSSEHNNNDY